MQEWQCRVAPSLGELEDTHQEIWGTKDYVDQDKPTVFFGLYGLPDFYTLWRHKGRKAILWAGTDITHFKNGYWLDKEGHTKIASKGLAQYLNRYCENWCENDVEHKALERLGIYAKVCPSFLGDVGMFEVSFKPGNRVYTSVSGDNFKLYGWDKIPKLAFYNPDIEFHLYGNSEPWICSFKNVVVHGRVPKDQMNDEIRDMQGALRLTEFDGFSEILAKSILMGQYPVSLILYPHMLPVKDLGAIIDKDKPNIEGRNYYLEILNKYPWTSTQ